MLMPRCGNFQASCTSDLQCAFNTCNKSLGLCNGFLSSTSTSSTIGTTTSQHTSAGTGLPLGADCNPSVPNACANDANCYATNSMLIPRCGNFQASCTSDAQCAFNTCNRAQGLCNGLLSASESLSVTRTTMAISPTATGLPLGSTCSPKILNACANGANCYAPNFMLIPVCGNLQASCSSNSQCAFNTCIDGFCNGFLPAKKNTTSATAATTVNALTIPAASGKSSTTSQISLPSSTGPIITNDGTEMTRGLVGLLAVAALVALLL
jgi:hypothetical protein